MIEKVSFTNFRAFREAEIPLAPFTLIVGPNSSGKTSILEGLHYLSQLGSRPPEMLFRGRLEPRRLATAGTEGPLRLGLEGTWDGISGHLDVSWPFLPHRMEADGGRETGLVMMTKWDGAEIDLPRENWGANLGNYKDPKEPLLGYIRSAVLLRLDPRKLAEPSFSEEIIPQTEFDGTNLAASLADMAIQTPDRYKTLIDKLRAIVPSILAVRFQKTSVESERFEQANKNGETLYRFVKVKTIAYQAVFDTVSGENISAPYTSEGTLLTLGLLSVIYGPAQPRLVLIDELERGLHPKALGILVSQIRDIQKEFPDLQVVATTHSPYLVDQFEANEVILTALRDDGSVGAARLSEHPDFERWKGEMASGEFWSTVGESWVIDRDAAKRS